MSNDIERWLKWLTDMAVLVRVIALALAALAGAIVERDVGVLPQDGPAQRSGSSFKLSADRAACPPLR